MRALARRTRLFSSLAACSLASLCAPCAAADPEIPEVARLQPAQLAQILLFPGSDKPLILQVGSHVLYREAHIAGSEYVGAAGQDTGLQALRDRVRALPRDQFIVIYCGCCPWSRCPNIRAAYRQLLSLGFTRVKALYIEDNFGSNWVDHRYPVAKGG
jgi:thiosulfate/3-mercaptopyruvate sulfurtransferase